MTIEPTTSPAPAPIGTGAPRARSLRWGPRSLRARLVVGVVGLAVTVVTLVGIGTYFALRSFLIGRLDQQLGPIASGNLGHVEICVRTGESPCSLSGPGQYRAPQTEWFTLLDAEGNVASTVHSDASLRAMQLSVEQRRSLVANPAGTETLTTTDGVELRVSTRVLSQQPNRSLVVVSGLSTDEVSRTLGRLVALELIIGGAVAIIAVLATTYGVRFSLRGLNRVTNTAQDVAAELSPEGTGLDRRVPVTEQGTEVGQLAESMNTLLAAVETQFAARVESEERMRRFLADASHELRTPLTSIRGYAELARMQRAAGAEKAGDVDDGNLGRIEAEGMRMSRLVEDLLMLARGDRSDLRSRELVDVAELIADAVNGARAAFPGRQIAMEASAAHQVIGDNDQLLRVVRNLVNNAAVHTRPEAPIRVRALADGPGVALQVLDGGPGLPPEEAAHVFERFWRADKARSRGRGGTGLGLSIVASIVHAHGGTVRFDSTVEGGSTVTVWLPAVDAVGHDG